LPKKRKQARKKATPHSRRVTGEKHDLIEAGKSTRFKPGISGNPAGRPRTKFLRNIARDLIEMVDNTKSKKHRAQRLIEVLLKEAEKGSLGHFKQVLNLLEEDSAAPRGRSDLMPEQQPTPPVHSYADLCAAMRYIYGLGDPESQARGASVLAAAEERNKKKFSMELYPATQPSELR
jgi:Family of unknown function (DUF5681)